VRGTLGSGHRYYRWGDAWGWLLSFSRHGFHISTPIFSLKLERRTKWYGEKACITCGEGHSGAHPDPCLGELPGVQGACCGHGDRADAYIGWENGCTIREFLVDDGSWKLDMEDWVPEDADLTGGYECVINGIHMSIDPDYQETAEDCEGLGRMLYEIARDMHKNDDKIHRAVHG